MRRRLASSSASSRTRWDSSAASRSSFAAPSSALARIETPPSRAACRMWAASSPSRRVAVSSSMPWPSADAGAACDARSSRSKKRSRSCRRDSSAATMRRKSRTSCWSNPRRDVPNDASATAAGDDGSGRENEMAMPEA